MLFQLSSGQINQLNQLYAKALTRPKDDVGAYEPVYQYIADQLKNTRDVDTLKTQTWFAGAARANCGEGPFAMMIREYTKEQAKLRGIHITDADIQVASNALGKLVVADFLSKQVKREPFTIDMIANQDALVIGDVLFKGLLNNPAWSGAVLFDRLGLDQKWRLWGYDGVVNSAQECDNVDFSAKAFFKAYESTTSLYQSLLKPAVLWALQDEGLQKDREILFSMAKLNGSVPMDASANDNSSSLAFKQSWLLKTQSKHLMNHLNQAVLECRNKYPVEQANISDDTTLGAYSKRVIDQALSAATAISPGAVVQNAADVNMRR